MSDSPGPHDGFTPTEALERRWAPEQLVAPGLPTREHLVEWLGEHLGMPRPPRTPREYADCYNRTCAYLAEQLVGQADAALADPATLWQEAIIHPSMPRDHRRVGLPLAPLLDVGVTQHQWSWAVNAIRRLRGLPRVAVAHDEEALPHDLVDGLAELLAVD